MDKKYVEHEHNISISYILDGVECLEAINRLQTKYDEIVQYNSTKYPDLNCSYKFRIELGDYYGDLYIDVKRLETDEEYNKRLEVIAAREKLEYQQYIALKKKFEPTTDQ